MYGHCGDFAIIAHQDSYGLVQRCNVCHTKAVSRRAIVHVGIYFQSLWWLRHEKEIRLLLGAYTFHYDRNASGG